MSKGRLNALPKCAMHRVIVKNTPNSKIINIYLFLKKGKLFKTKNVQGGLNDYLFFFELFFFFIILKTRNTSFLFNKKWSFDAIVIIVLGKKEESLSLIFHTVITRKQCIRIE